jgi:hypothetical protein
MSIKGKAFILVEIEIGEGSGLKRLRTASSCMA